MSPSLVAGDDSIRGVTDPGNVLVFILIWCLSGLERGRAGDGAGDGGREEIRFRLFQVLQNHSLLLSSLKSCW